MAKTLSGSQSSLLSSAAPSVSRAAIEISHVQLRDLIICPQEAGVVNYVQRQSIVEHDLHSKDNDRHIVLDLDFTPTTVTSLPIPSVDGYLLAAGGQDAELCLSLQSSRQRRPSSSSSSQPCSRTRRVWKLDAHLKQRSINNSVLLTHNPGSSEPRLGVSNNDKTVSFYDIPMKTDGQPKDLAECGTLRLDVPVNHSSISPDGQTLLSVGDSSTIYLHRMSGSGRVSFTPITQLKVPISPSPLPPLLSAHLAASFSTCFSANGTKFAVASQEGVVAVWDVRSTNPLKVFDVDKSRKHGTSRNGGNGAASGWIFDDSWDLAFSQQGGPAWCPRNVKFGSQGNSEVLTFTEHTSLTHVVDARTFESEEVIRIPRVSEVPAPTCTPHSAAEPLDRRRSHPHRRRSHVSPHLYLALEETFHIPNSPTSPTSPSSPSRRPSLYHVPGHPTPHWEEMNEGDLQSAQERNLMVVPPLGDRAVDDDVRRLLSRAQHMRPQAHVWEGLGVVSQHGDDDDAMIEYADASVAIRERERRTNEEMEMDIDELESDCADSRDPSRSSSPTPSTHFPHQPSGSPRARLHSQAESYALARGERESYEEMFIGHGSARPRPDGELDIAGVCFDPKGRHLYVATTESVCEWGVKRTQKRWWDGSRVDDLDWA